MSNSIPLPRSTTPARRNNAYVKDPVYREPSPEYELPFEFLQGDSLLPDDMTRIIRSIAYLKEENDRLRAQIEALMGDGK